MDHGLGLACHDGSGQEHLYFRCRCGYFWTIPTLDAEGLGMTTAHLIVEAGLTLRRYARRHILRQAFLNKCRVTIEEHRTWLDSEFFVRLEGEPEDVARCQKGLGSLVTEGDDE